jgi:4-hydroxy-2-oxoheptanedioate aldolase
MSGTGRETNGRDRVRERWDRGEPAFDLWIDGLTVVAVEEIGATDYDSVIIDMQHTPYERADLIGLLIALGGDSPSPLVRVPGNDRATIGKVLDAGARGVICPQVEDRAAAEAFVGATRYPPDGDRSFGPMRAAARGMAEPLAVAQIESVEALERAAEIAATPGLDMLFIGPADMSLSAGGPARLDCESPAAIERHRRLVDAAHGAGIKAGMIALDGEAVRAGLDWGMDFLSLGGTRALLLGAADRTLERAVSLAGGARAAAGQGT